MVYSRWIFPALLDQMMGSSRLFPYRKQLLTGAGSEVLELGFGTGHSLPFYPEETELIHVVEPDNFLKKRAFSKIKQAGIEVEYYPMSAESLPFEDNRFEFVVCSWTLCSIANLEKALSEIYRVLKPGGVFEFLEHGLNPNLAVQKWQNRLNGVQKIVGQGCHLNRDFWPLIEAVGFEWQSKENLVITGLPRIIDYHYRARVTKP